MLSIAAAGQNINNKTYPPSNKGYRVAKHPFEKEYNVDYLSLTNEIHDLN